MQKDFAIKTYTNVVKHILAILLVGIFTACASGGGGGGGGVSDREGGPVPVRPPPNLPEVMIIPVGPDLVFVAASVDDRTLIPEQSFTITSMMLNQGRLSSAETVMRYYRSPDEEITIDDEYTGGQDDILALDEGEKSTKNRILTAPRETGTYYYGICITAVDAEIDESNNCSEGMEVRVGEVGSFPGADLLLEGEQVSDNMLSTQAAFILSINVRNQGTNAAAATTLRFYRSDDAEITTNDEDIGSSSIEPILTEAARMHEMTLTAASSSGTHYYGVCVEAVQGESDTTNNCSAAVEVTVQTRPDLRVEATTSNNEVLVEEPFTLSALVRNFGEVDATATTLRFYRSTDATISSDDAEIGTRSIAELAGGGEESPETISLTAPDTPDVFYYGACVDRVEGEPDDGNNCSVGVQVTFLYPPSNLIVEGAAVAPEILLVEANLRLSATVRNQGEGQSPATNLRFFRSDNAAITTDDDEVGTAAPIAPLGVGETSPQAIDLTVPAQADTYYYGACVVAVDRESNTADNCSAGVEVTVQAPPDLRVEATTNNNEVLVDDPFTLTAIVRNLGEADVAATILRFYRSVDETISSDDAPIGTRPIVGLLGGGGESPETISLTAPDTPDVFYYGACVDRAEGEPDDGNNCSVGVQVTFLYPPSNLIVEGAAVEPAILLAGANLRLSATVRNQGEGQSPATNLRFFRSDNAAITTDDDEVGTAAPIAPLGVGETSPQAIDLTVPAQADTYYYGACVVAVDRESNTADNCSAGVEVTVQAPPDLRVEATTNNNEVLVDDPFTLTAIVRNLGEADVAATILRFYRSVDATISSDDAPIGTRPIVGLLGGGGESPETISLTAPDTPDVFYYGACVDRAEGEPDDGNNCSVGVQVTFLYPPSNLIVEGAAVEPAILLAGANLRLSATVRNQGEGQSPATNLRFFRSDDAAITTDDDEVGIAALVAPLGVGETSPQAIDLKVPAQADTYYYGACVVAVDRESNTADNCSAGVEVTVQAPPDLRVEATTNDNEVLVEEPFTLTALVRNLGEADVAATTLRFYRSVDETISSDDAPIGTRPIVGLLGGGGESPETISLTAPDTPDVFYYGACVDRVEGEPDDGNNCSVGVQVTFLYPPSNLIVEGAAVAPAILLVEANLRLSATVRNQGAGQSPATNLRFFRSDDATITTGDNEVGIAALVAPLGVGETSPQAIDFKVSAQANTYYYGACVVAVDRESNITDNCSAGVEVTVQAPPDLRVDAMADSDEVLVDDPFTLTAIVRNAGDANAAATILRFYRSVDATISSDDAPIGTRPIVGLLGGGESPEAIDLTTPSNPDIYYYGACVDMVESESDVGNNCSAGFRINVTAPDLIVGDAQVDDNTLTTGDLFRLSAIVRNVGTGASTATTLRYYRSLDADIGTDDDEFGSSSVGGIGAGGMNPQDAELTAVAAGDYYYGVCVESVDKESNSTNNCSAGVQVTIIPPPDLLVEAPAADEDNLLLEDAFNFSATVRNRGAGPAPETTLRYYISTDEEITTGDIEVGTATSVEALAAGATSPQRASITTTLAGDYFYGACVVVVDKEADTANNCSDGVAVRIRAPDLFINLLIIDDASLGVGDSFALRAAVRNMGREAALSSTLRYYRSRDAMQSSDDVLLGTDFVSALDMSGGNSSIGDIDITSPNVAGIYYYIACVDPVAREGNIANNCRAIRADVLGADLLVDQVSVSNNILQTRETFTLSARVRGLSSYASAPTTLRYYVSDDATITPDDDQVGARTIPRLSERSMTSRDVQVAAPANPGTYYYGACAVPVDAEPDTTNNCSDAVEVTAVAPDLLIDESSASPSRLRATESSTLSIRISNQGTGAAEPTIVRYYRSTDSTITPDDASVGMQSVSAISAAGMLNLNLGFVAPSGGTYYYGACVDSVVEEANTANNCSAGVEVVVLAPDRAVTSVRLVGTLRGTTILRPGQGFGLIPTLGDVGTDRDRIYGSLYSLYISDDPTITLGDSRVGNGINIVNPGSVRERPPLFVFAPEEPGTYYYGICISPIPRFETNVANNCSPSIALTVQ